MNRISQLVLAVLVMTAFSVVPAFAQGTVVYSSIPSPTPPNVDSLGYQATQTAEFGDKVGLEADTPSRTGFATVLMSNWSLHSNYTDLPTAGYTHPITLNIYLDATSAAAHAPVKTVTQDFLIPWRPEADPTCDVVTKWRSPSDYKCYNGFAFTITFDLRSLNYDLPDQFIYGIAYNTNTWGYVPIGTPGPYDSLNVGLTTGGVTVGTDPNVDSVFWNTAHGSWYTPAGVGGIFREDFAWTPYTPAVQFTTFAVPTTTASCKNGAWANLVRSDFTSFKNQGACVSYVQTGK